MAGTIGKRGPDDLVREEEPKNGFVRRYGRGIRRVPTPRSIPSDPTPERRPAVTSRTPRLMR